MTNLTTNTMPDTAPNGGRKAYPIANGVTLGAGALVMLDGNGYLTHWLGSSAGSKFRGILANGDSKDGDGALVGDTSLAIPPEGHVDESGVTLTHRSIGGTVNQGVVGDPVYSADSDPASLTLAATTANPVGVVTRFRSATDVDVELFSAQAFAAAQNVT